MSDKEIAKRASTPRHHIDAGFINRRKCFTVFGRTYAEAFESRRHPGDDHLSVLMNDHLLIHLALEQCCQQQVPTLAESLNDPKPRQLFCSTADVIGCGDAVYDEDRASNSIKLPFETDYSVSLEYHTKHIYADTQRMHMSDGCKLCVVAEIFKVEDGNIIAHPLVIGPPTYDNPYNRNLPFDFTFDGWTHYQLHPSDIDQFKDCSKIEVELNGWMNAMKFTPEEHVKKSFCRLLADDSSTDWGGEQYDHFSADVTLNGERKTAAFMFKGPSAWGEMKPKHLGKNGDQIYRLQQSDADILILQHCHHVGEAVRETLRAFAVSPSRPRHYCIIDGKDTFRILKAYGLDKTPT